jgi:hypothetical protein
MLPAFMNYNVYRPIAFSLNRFAGFFDEATIGR